MSATLLKGKVVVEAIKEDLSQKISALAFQPKLVFIRVGEDPASVSYVRGKESMAKAIGMDAQTIIMPEDSSQEALLAQVQQLNDDDTVDGILVQLPLPKHLDDEPILELIDPAKDVDGFHTVNVGRLWTGQKGLVPCTPSGLIQIMDYYNLPIEGKHVVIVGRSNLVGKPAAALFLARNATVSLAHSRTKDLASLVKTADVVVAAVGRAGMITADMIKEGAILLDVGITRIDGKLKGDIHPDAAEVASYLTPMPGGTGPLTVAMLMQNTYSAALQRRLNA